MKYLSILDNIFNKKRLNEDVDVLLKSLTNFTKEDFEALKYIASGVQTSNDDNVTPKTRSFLDIVERAFNRSFDYGENSPQTRRHLYQIYDEMDEEVAYVSAALDIISDDATQSDQDGKVIKVFSNSDKVTSLTEDFIDSFELEEKLAKWARLVAKYGDFFVRVSYEEGKGITKIYDNIYPSRVERKELDGELIAFAETEDSVTSRFCPPWDYVHFKHKGDISKDQDRVNDLSGSDFKDHDILSCYGQSILRAAVKVYSQLRFVENMLLLSRLTNSIRRNIFMINVGDVAPDKAFETIQNYANLLKKNINLDLDQGMYNAQKKTVSYDEDIFIPVADPKNDVRIEQVGGDVNIAEQYDLEYLLNKLFSALKIPKAYLNYEQDLNARSTLVQLDIRYARSVTRLQQTLRGGLLRLAKINLAFNGIDPETVDLDIQLTPVSTIDAEAKRQEAKDKLDVASTMWRTVCDINDKLSGGTSPSPAGGLMAQLGGGSEPSSQETSIDLKYTAELIFTDFMGLSKESVDKIFKKSSDKDNPNKKGSGVKTVVFHRTKSSDPDIHAPYPIGENINNYEKLRESLNSQNQTDEEDEL